jgi:hypothetical protein
VEPDYGVHAFFYGRYRKSQWHSGSGRRRTHEGVRRGHGHDVEPQRVRTLLAESAIGAADPSGAHRGPAFRGHGMNARKEGTPVANGRSFDTSEVGKRV